MIADGAVLVGFEERQSPARFRAVAASTGVPLDGDFSEAVPADVSDAAARADAALPVFGGLNPGARAAFLELVAVKIEAVGPALIERAMAETGLPQARLEGERGRTCGQLRLFAAQLRRGDWLDVTIDPALPERQPLPRPDLRRCNMPVGPVAVFGASNFPLAFSVAGGDTASALAAGCPVIVKGHPAHPGTGELVARAVLAAVRESGLPEGVFSYLPGTSHALGEALVADPRVKAVGFTGSRAGGLALARIAGARAEPIPVYAEMSSINPVLLFPNAARTRGAALGQAYVASLTMGAGQFCTNPGLVIGFAGPDLEAFVDAAAHAMSGVAAQPMLTPAIHGAYETGVATLAAQPGVAPAGCGLAAASASEARAAIYRTTAEAFMANPRLGKEIFGCASLLVEVRDEAELRALLNCLEGQLTATVLTDPADEAMAARIIPLLAQRAGRVLANGWPTGVEVCHAMVHGGPFPATSDVRTTSVGTLAMMRFVRPVCFQNIADALLPEPLRAANPWNLPRTIDGIRVDP